MSNTSSARSSILEQVGPHAEAVPQAMQTSNVAMALVTPAGDRSTRRYCTLLGYDEATQRQSLAAEIRPTWKPT